MTKIKLIVIVAIVKYILLKSEAIMKETINTNKAPQAIGPYSQAIATEGFLFLSGQIPINPETNLIEGSTIDIQARQVMKNIEAVLNEAGMTFDDAVKTTCFLSDMEYFGVFNQIYSEYFTGHPARSCVAVKELPKNALCEVEVIAHK